MPSLDARFTDWCAPDKPDMQSVKLSLRLTLLTMMSLLVGTAVLVVGYISYRHAQFAANHLARQLLEQTMARIESQIENLLSRATKLNASTEERLKSGRIRADDFVRFVQYSLDAIEIGGELSGFYVGLEANGNSVGVSHLKGKPSIWQSKKDPRGEAYRVSQFWPADYPEHPFASNPQQPGPDIRRRPWYVQARSARRSIWTDVFVFLGVEGVEDVHGLTYATPVYDAGGELLAVLDSDFELQQLSRFLKTLKLGTDGFAFVIGRQADGTRRVIAHPELPVLRRRNSSRDATASELISPAEFPDPRVAAFAAQMKPTRSVGQDAARSPMRFLAQGEAYLGAVKTLDSDSSPPWIICAVIPESEVLGEVERSIQFTLLIGVGVLAMALIASRYVSGQVSRPLERLALEANAIQRLLFRSQPVVHSSVREVDHLAVAIEEMKAGLRSFRKYIPNDLFRSFLSSGREAEFGGARRTVTIFFSDVAEFTSIVEDQEPEQVVDLLREYLNTLCQEIDATDGTVDKFIGDSVMAFWDNPATGRNHATAACTAALRCQSALYVLNERWTAEGKRAFRTRIGLHTGDVVVGNIGTEARLNYTIIGDAVNLSNRLQLLNKAYGTEILISEPTYLQARADILARPLDYVAVKGRRLPVLIYELLGLKTDGSWPAEQDAMIASCERGLECYRNRDWSKAIAHFENVLRQRPGDPPASLLIQRCRSYQQTAPGPDWDGVHRMEHK
jgi:adenylate cyclase